VPHCRAGFTIRASHRSWCARVMRADTGGTARSAGALLRKEKVMVTIKVKGGTPQGSDTLCRTCSYGHIIKGFRATEEEVYCRYFYLEREIHFPVSECTFYEDRRLASKREMERSPGFCERTCPGAAWALSARNSFENSKPKQPFSTARCREVILLLAKARYLLTFAFCSPIVRGGRGNGKRPRGLFAGRGVKRQPAPLPSKGSHEPVAVR